MNLRKGQKGQALILALIMLVFGSLVVISLLAYLDASIRSQAKAEDRMEHYYSADAGVEFITAALLVRDDALVTQLDVDLWSGDPVNGHTPTAMVTDIDESNPGYKDYTVVASSGNTTITAVLRQYRWLTSTFVETRSWES